MKNFFLAFCLFPLTLLNAQSLSGTWACGPAEGQYFEKETIYFSPGGYYYLVQDHVKLEWQEEAMRDISCGIYYLENNTLLLIDLQKDTKYEYQFSGNPQGRFRLSANGLTWTYDRESGSQLTAEMRHTVSSWETYRKLEGNWRSAESTLKFIPSQGIAIIRSNTDADHFKWGYFAIDGDLLILRDISPEEAEFYRGRITGLSRNRFDLTSSADGYQEVFTYQSTLDLDELETAMVSQYMTMMHRLNMSIIGAMNGTRYIWKRVDEYGNEWDW
jgi:hypothetical protein